MVFYDSAEEHDKVQSSYFSADNGQADITCTDSWQMC